MCLLVIDRSGGMTTVGAIHTLPRKNWWGFCGTCRPVPTTSIGRVTREQPKYQHL